MDQELGYNDRKQVHPIKGFLFPSLQELILYIALSLILIFITLIDDIWFVLTNFSNIEHVPLSEALNYQEMIVEPYLIFRYTGDATVFFIWGLVGCVSYMIVWGIQHIVLKLKEDVEEKSFVGNNRLSNYWQSKFSQHLFFATTVFVSVVYVGLFVSVVSLMNGFAKVTLFELGNPVNYLYLILAVSIGVLYFYIFVRLWKILNYSVKMYFAGTND